MNLTVTKEPIGISELVYSTNTEQALECDVMLPDFCPDIVKVLSCQADSVLTDLTHSAGRLTAEGIAKLTVLYLDSEGGLRRAEYKLPFSKNLDLKAVEGQPIITAVAQTAYINCRAVSSRRLDIRGAVSIAVKMWIDKEEEAIIDADGEGIELKLHHMESCRVIGRINQPLTQQEDLEVPQGKPDPVHVVWASGAATISECRSIGGRVVIKGELALRICYATDEQCRRFETADYLLPMSQIVDAPSANDNCSCECRLVVCGCDAQVARDPAGAAIFEVEVQMMAGITLCESRQITLATDCYSTRFPCEGRRKKLPISSGGSRVQERQAYKTTVNIGDDVDSLIYVWARLDKVAYQAGHDMGAVAGKILISALCNVGDSLDYRERSADFSIPLPAKMPRDFVPDVSMSLPAASLASPGEMELRCDIQMAGTASEGGQMEALCEIHLDGSAPFETDPAVGMRIYFTEPGESVWDIAKRYHTSEAMIIADNGLESDLLPERRALIIPSV